jgi:protein-S-isoprenylcysteine O-methyltransferase Ste14
MFRWRSFLPVVLFPLMLYALSQSEIIEKRFGDRAQTVWEFACLFVSLAGLAIRVNVSGHSNLATSGRNTKRQLAEKLNTTGIYSVVRHPLYLGNFVIMLGMALFTQVWWLVGFCVLLFTLYYERIMFAEEAFLQRQFGEDFTKWASRTPAFIPSFANYVPPRRPFIWKNALKREYTTQIQIFGGFFLLDVAADIVGDSIFEIETPWAVLFALSIVAYFAIRFLKRQTTLLDVKPRRREQVPAE